MKLPRPHTPTAIRLLGLLPVIAGIAAAAGPAPVDKPVSPDPMRFEIRAGRDLDPETGEVTKLDFWHIRAPGNDEILAMSQVYRTVDGPKHAIDLVIEAILAGNFVIVDRRPEDRS